MQFCKAIFQFQYFITVFMRSHNFANGAILGEGGGGGNTKRNIKIHRADQ